MDYNFITDRIATGAGLVSTGDVDQLAQDGIRVVIDCRAEFDDHPLLVKHPEILYLWNGVFDDGKPKPTSWFTKALDFTLPLIAKPTMKFYFHCAMGINRGPSMAYAFMRAALGLGGDVTEKLIRLARPKVGL